MKYNPKVSANCNSPQHHRRSIRLKGYDYSQSGLYFITMCCQNRAHLFGEIIDGEMVLNEAGKMVDHWYYELQNKFNDIQCREMVVMPNHFHCIIEIVNDNDLRGCEMDAQIHIPIDDDVGARRGRPMCLPNDSKTGLPCYNMGEHIGSPLRANVPIIVQWFKTMTTNHYIRGVKQNGWQPFDGKLWQRNYWERIIRDENEHYNIAEYIINNPSRWGDDKLNINYDNIQHNSRNKQLHRTR